jgi:hypothetical protein
MSRWFMLHNGMHHRVDEGLYLHYRGTCDVHDVTEVSTARSPWAPRSTAMNETRLAASRLGWVAICYEKKGVMTFFVQLNPRRAAWQRIEWPTGFEKNWDEGRVREAIDNFIWVAECEEAKQILPK